jgi:SpoVK/Ycf46/Vps4 family AAA+-type ATPase
MYPDIYICNRAALTREAAVLALQANINNTVPVHDSSSSSFYHFADTDSDLRVATSVSQRHFMQAAVHVGASSRRGTELAFPARRRRRGSDASQESEDGGSEKDLAGLGSVQLRLAQCVMWPLQFPQAFARLGLTRPRGVLLSGPPGCGKTALARSLAGNLRTAFLMLSASQLFSQFLGEAERKLRDLFSQARANLPCLVFFDEIDCLVGSREGASSSGGVRLLGNKSEMIENNC